jgi:two-component system, cell cycle sensor histidine kinase and response regulator CckA
MDSSLIDRDASLRWLIGVVAIICLMLIIAGAWFYSQQRNQARQLAEEQLLTIARFKASEISQWRAERLRNAVVLAKNPFFLEAAQAWIKSPDPKNSQKILDHFRAIQSQYSCLNVLLTSPEGKILLALEGLPRNTLVESAVNSLTEALRDKRVVMTDLLPATEYLPIRLNTIAPLIISPSDGAVPFGALVLVSNVQDYLYPLIQSWPISSISAESLLVRRDSDSILFLNELRHRKETALKLRVPLTRKNVPAVMAVLGGQSIVEGFDYRGVKVFAALQPVEGTDWYLVAKTDESEALAAWHYRSLLIIGLIISFFLAAMAIVWAVWQRRMKASYRLRLESEKAQRATELKYGIMLMCIGDGVIVADAQGIVTLMNPVAEELTGWTNIEAQGKPVEVIFDICNENTRQKVENPIRKVIECGRTVGLANHTILISRSGDEHPIMDSSAPIRETDGALIGIVLVFRDQTEERKAQRLLQTERDNLQAILRASPVGLLVCDEARYVISASPEAERLAGRNFKIGERLQCGEFMGCCHSLTDSKGDGESEACEACPLKIAISEALLEGKGTHNQDYCHERQLEGFRELLYWSFSVEPFVFDGHPHAVVAIRDISERRKAVIKLRKNHDLLNEVGEAAQIGGWELDLDSMIGTWTDAMYHIFDIPLGQKPAIKDALLYYHPKDRPKISDALNNAIEKGEPYDLELRFTTAKGKSLWVRALCKPFVENGKIKRLLGILQDITRRKQADLELKERTEEIERYFSTALDLFCITDSNGNFKRLNQEWSRLLGYRLEELEGRSLFEFIHPDDLESTKQALSELNRQMLVPNHINRFSCRDGSWRWLEWRASLSGDNICAAARNVTDRILAEQHSEKLAQQLQQAMKMEAVGRLAGGVAHDFNNLLTGIGGYTDLIIAGLSPGDPILADLNEIKKGTERAAVVTSQLLAFSRKQLIEPKVLSLNHIVANLKNMLQRLIGEDIQLKTMLSHELESVKIDLGQFEQILVNLAVNARDAMPDGGMLTIETANIDIDENYCSTHPYVTTGRHVMLAVNDTGCGMTEEVKNHLFEPFYTTKEKGKGTGLGLATIYGIVKQSGGSIEVYSEPGRGTAFKIYLPAQEEGPQRLEIERPVSPSMLNGKETILLVEDEEIVRELATKLLKRLKYNVLHASNGTEAIEIAQNYSGVIDLLLTDVVMPGMNGRQLAEKLQQILPDIKVLFTSGYTENAIAHHGIIEKDLNFIGKPYSYNDLAKKIRRLLD